MEGDDVLAADVGKGGGTERITGPGETGLVASSGYRRGWTGASV